MTLTAIIILSIIAVPLLFFAAVGWFVLWMGKAGL